MMEGLEEVRTPLVANGKAAVAGEPGERTLRHPAVSAQPFAAVDATTGDPWGDAATATGLAAASVIVSLVSVQLFRSPAWPSGALPDRRHGVDQGREELAVVSVGRRDQQGERDAVGVDQEVALAARLAAVGRVRAGLLAPLLAGTDPLSRLARLQSIAFARPSRSSKTWWSLAQTPASCQSRSRRQQLIPLPQPISCGNISQGMPLFSTNKMPVSAARLGIGGRPPFGRGLGAGNRGSISAHSASVTSGLAMTTQTSARHPGSRFC